MKSVLMGALVAIAPEPTAIRYWLGEAIVDLADVIGDDGLSIHPSLAFKLRILGNLLDHGEKDTQEWLNDMSQE